MILENAGQNAEAGADISEVSFSDLRKMMNGEEITPEPAKGKEPSEVAEPVKPATESIAAESDPAETEETKTEATGKPGNLQKRFDKLAKTIRELEAENTALKTVKTPETKQAVATPDPAKDGAPKQEDFPDWEAYEDARLEYKLTQREAAKAKTEAERVAQTEAAAADERVTKQIIAATVKYSDYEAVVTNPKLAVSELMVSILRASENSGAEILYALGKNPELAEKIYDMPPGAAALALGRLEGKLFPDESPKPAVTAPAPKVLPKPPSTVGATAPGSKALTDDMPYSEFKTLFNTTVLGRK